MFMHKLRLLLLRMTEPILWTLTLLPLFVMVSAAQNGHLYPAWLCLLITLGFGCLIVSMKKHRLLTALLGSAVLFLAIYPYYSRLPMLVLPVLGSIVLLYTASSKSQDKAYVNPVVRTMIGIALYLIAQYAAWRSDISTFSAYYFIGPSIVFGFILFFFIELLILNGRTVQEEAVGDRVPAAVVRHNIALVILAFLFAAFVACIPALGQALLAVWNAVRKAFRELIRLLMSLLPESEVAPSGGGGGEFAGMEAMEAAEPSLLAIWLERIVGFLAFLVILFLLYIGIKIICKKLSKLLVKLKAYLLSYMASASQDYVDEISDTRKTNENKQYLFFRRKRKRAYRQDMSNAEKIRYAYGVMIDRHPEWKESATAREQLGANAALYEKVRYAEKEASAEEADSFSRLTHSKTLPEQQAAREDRG